MIQPAVFGCFHKAAPIVLLCLKTYRTTRRQTNSRSVKL